MLSWQASHGSQHHQLCCCDLQFLIQNHTASSHGPLARVLSPSSFPQRLSCSLPNCYRELCMAATSWFLASLAAWQREPQNRVVPLLWLLLLGLNPSAHLPLQPHFRPLLQPVTPASIPVFFQLYWAAIVSLGTCGPTVWSQSSPSSYAGSITRGSCLPVTSWVEVTPISLAQSMATAV